MKMYKIYAVSASLAFFVTIMFTTITQNLMFGVYGVLTSVYLILSAIFEYLTRESKNETS